MSFTLPRYLLSRVAQRFTPQFALRRQIPTITAIPHTLRASLPTVWMKSHTSIKMEHPSARIVIDSSQMIEEETVRASKLEYYYPVRIGEVFQDRYRVIGKLGYGSASTVWLCHDLQNNKGYVALKVYINRSKVHRELPIYTHIKSLNSEHAGLESLRKLLDSFEITSPHGNHICLVHEAMGMGLEELRNRVPNREFAADLIRQTLRDVLRVLHFFAKKPMSSTQVCNFFLLPTQLPDISNVEVIDIQPMNILMGVLDDSPFARFEREELQDPMPLKESPSHPVYLSRPMPFTKGSPLLCDLSEARFDDPANGDLIMPDVYRAPEVLLGMPWSYPVDVWGFAMTVRTFLRALSSGPETDLVLWTAMGPFPAEATFLSTQWRRTIL